MRELSPVLLFAYNRPEHTERTLKALADNALAIHSRLVIFCDGPRTRNEAENTRRVREIARQAEGFRSVQVVERPSNLGLAQSIISGVTEVLEAHDTVIVLEDDLITSPFFLQYMNEALQLYADDEQVLSVCGYTFPVSGQLPETFFLPGAFCWGWATWRRAWTLYEHDAEKLLAEIIRRNLIYEFDFRGTDPLAKILQMTVNRDARADSWATRWMGTACIHGKMTLYPGRSLVENAGFDGSGRHANHERRFDTPLADRSPRVERLPLEVNENVVRQHRNLFRQWRIGDDIASRLYYRIAALLPAAAEKYLYTRLVRRRLRRQATAAIARVIDGH
ncbi:glycosyltransferase family 2 protein [Methylonatrum kenyense]|uniref:glycosyltransferase family A protein n=1 Tax=Methylonatrum kenyense TaxID=455253 RepID=UPI0020C11B34|nr:glycosyltransferase family A protein [Methylonatrum kenyense]MCK8516793.1 glycosyltransferase family 2 protein [Methylonatrum kenyense]